MGKLVYDISMTVDGLIAGPNVRPEAGLGDGGERLHDWFFAATDPRTQAVIDEALNSGATICGRTTYELSLPYWGADGPTGPMRLPTIILTHSVPDDVPENSVYIFVEDIDTAVALAQDIAGDKPIGVMSANTVQQFIQRGLLDEISLHVVPLLFGRGVRLLEYIGLDPVQLEPIAVIPTSDAIHVRYRVIR